jgi:hypothetical protein
MTGRNRPKAGVPLQQHAYLLQISRLVIGLVGLSTDGSELNRGLYVKQGDIFGLKSLEQANELLFGNCQADLGWLIGQLKKMRGMKFSRMPKAFDTSCQGGAAQPHFFGQIDEPVTQHFSVMTTVLLGKENHQKAFHD